MFCSETDSPSAGPMIVGVAVVGTLVSCLVEMVEQRLCDEEYTDRRCDLSRSSITDVHRNLTTAPPLREAGARGEGAGDAAAHPRSRARAARHARAVAHDDLGDRRARRRAAGHRLPPLPRRALAVPRLLGLVRRPQSAAGSGAVGEDRRPRRARSRPPWTRPTAGTSGSSRCSRRCCATSTRCRSSPSSRPGASPTSPPSRTALPPAGACAGRPRSGCARPSAWRSTSRAGERCTCAASAAPTRSPSCPRPFAPPRRGERRHGRVTRAEAGAARDRQRSDRRRRGGRQGSRAGGHGLGAADGRDPRRGRARRARGPHRVRR